MLHFISNPHTRFNINVIAANLLLYIISHYADNTKASEALVKELDSYF